MAKKVNLVEDVVEEPAAPVELSPPDTPPIEKPAEPSLLDRFKSKRSPLIAGVETLQTALPHYRIADANDWVRLHPDPAYWSDELCFVTVPVIGTKDGHLHLIDETLAMANLASKKIQRFRLALASKPNDVFFLCQVPSQNLDNPWNYTNLQACVEAKEHWTQGTSRKAEGVEGYQISYARSPEAFPSPKWPSTPLSKLIEVTFASRMIFDEQHPGLKRLLGDKIL